MISTIQSRQTNVSTTNHSNLDQLNYLPDRYVESRHTYDTDGCFTATDTAHKSTVTIRRFSFGSGNDEPTKLDVDILLSLPSKAALTSVRRRSSVPSLSRFYDAGDSERLCDTNKLTIDKDVSAVRYCDSLRIVRQRDRVERGGGGLEDTLAQLSGNSGTSRVLRIMKEASRLVSLAHENIVTYTDLILTPRELYVVQNASGTRLDVILDKTCISAEHSKLFLYQLLRGLKFMHTAGIHHPRLTPADILVSCNELLLKITGYIKDTEQPPISDSYSHLAPEQLMTLNQCEGHSADFSSPAADIWAVGCVFAEMLLNKTPLFTGSTHMETLLSITQYIHLTDEDWSRVMRVMPNKLLKNHPFRPRTPLCSVLSNHSHHAIQLLEQLLSFRSDDRLTVEEALKHDYLSSYHCPTDEPCTLKLTSYPLQNINITYNTENRYRDTVLFHQCCALNCGDCSTTADCTHCETKCGDLVRNSGATTTKCADTSLVCSSGATSQQNDSQISEITLEHSPNTLDIHDASESISQISSVAQGASDVTDICTPVSATTQQTQPVRITDAERKSTSDDSRYFKSTGDDSRYFKSTGDDSRYFKSTGDDSRYFKSTGGDSHMPASVQRVGDANSLSCSDYTGSGTVKADIGRRASSSKQRDLSQGNASLKTKSVAIGKISNNQKSAHGSKIVNTGHKNRGTASHGTGVTELKSPAGVKQSSSPRAGPESGVRHSDGVQAGSKTSRKENKRDASIWNSDVAIKNRKNKEGGEESVGSDIIDILNSTNESAGGGSGDRRGDGESGGHRRSGDSRGIGDRRGSGDWRGSGDRRGSEGPVGEVSRCAMWKLRHERSSESEKDVAEISDEKRMEDAEVGNVSPQAGVLAPRLSAGCVCTSARGPSVVVEELVTVAELSKDTCPLLKRRLSYIGFTEKDTSRSEKESKGSSKIEDTTPTIILPPPRDSNCGEGGDSNKMKCVERDDRREKINTLNIMNDSQNRRDLDSTRGRFCTDGRGDESGGGRWGGRKLMLDKIESEKTRQGGGGRQSSRRDQGRGVTRCIDVELTSEEFDDLYRLPTDHLRLEKDRNHSAATRGRSQNRGGASGNPDLLRNQSQPSEYRVRWDYEMGSYVTFEGRNSPDLRVGAVDRKLSNTSTSGARSQSHDAWMCAEGRESPMSQLRLLGRVLSPELYDNLGRSADGLHEGACGGLDIDYSTVLSFSPPPPLYRPSIELDLHPLVRRQADPLSTLGSLHLDGLDCSSRGIREMELRLAGSGLMSPPQRGSGTNTGTYRDTSSSPDSPASPRAVYGARPKKSPRKHRAT